MVKYSFFLILVLCSCMPKGPLFSPSDPVKDFAAAIKGKESLILRGAELTPYQYTLNFESDKCIQIDEARRLATSGLMQFMLSINESEKNMKMFKPFPINEENVRFRIVFSRAIENGAFLSGVSIEHGKIKYYSYDETLKKQTAVYSESFTDGFRKAFGFDVSLLKMELGAH